MIEPIDWAAVMTPEERSVVYEADRAKAHWLHLAPQRTAIINRCIQRAKYRRRIPDADTTERRPSPRDTPKSCTPYSEARRMKTVSEKPETCPVCKGERWVCEEHPDTPWDGGDGCCGGAGMPCRICNPSTREIPPAMPPGFVEVEP